jgi:flagellar hook-associated protein 2
MRELPRLPVVNDSTLVLALADAEHQGQDGAAADLPFSAVLPTPAQLVTSALNDPPPTELHLQFQRHIGNALSALAAAAGGVAAAASALSPHNAFNAFQQVGVSSSHPAIASGSALHGARISSYGLQVLRLASAQENVGELLAREAPAAIEPGQHSFELRSFAGIKLLSQLVVEGETNDSVLTQMAAAINQANLGVIATLARPTFSTVQIAITATLSGSASSFSLSDVDGWLVRLSGASKEARPAQDAAYVLDGVRTMSPTNQLLLQGGKIQLTLHTISRGADVTIAVGPDGEAVLGAVEQLAEAVSQLAEVIDENQRYLSPTFVGDFSSAVQALEPQLRQIGVEVVEDNSVAVNRAAFEYAFEQQPELVESTVSSPNGAAQRIGGFAAEVMSAPISRYGAREFIPPVLPPTSHPTPQMILASNSLSALLYAQLLAQGLFINSLF